MGSNYYLFLLLIPAAGYWQYKKYINTCIKAIFAYFCKSGTSSYVNKIDNNIYNIKFKINDKLYSFHFKINNGPTSIDSIKTTNKDVTKQVEPYFNFYNAHILSIITPEMLGYKQLTIEYGDGDEKHIIGQDNMLENTMV